MKSRLMILVLLGVMLVGCAGNEATPTATVPAETATLQPTVAADNQVFDAAIAGPALVQMFIDGKWEQAVATFDSSVAGALPAETLQSTWEQLQVQFGDYQSMAQPTIVERDNLQLVSIITDFADDQLDVQIAYNQQGQVAGLFFRPVQAQVDPEEQPDDDSFTETGVRFGDEPWELRGVITLPKGDGPFPAVILVHGSGPSDLDETIGPNKPFRDIAWGLASNGVAVLRYDKRTYVYASEMQGLQMTVQEETITDAVAAATFLRQQANIDDSRVYILGHSLGGTLIPRIAEQDPDSAGFIILGGATIPLEDKLIEQINYIANFDQEVTAAEQSQIDQITQQVNVIKSPELDATTPLSTTLGVPASYWLDLRNYDPAQAAQAIERPLLILQGERDYQVTMEDFAGWQATLKDRSNVEFRQYPDLNHLFMKGEGPGSPVEYETPNRVDPQVIKDIVDWIN